MNHMHRSSTHDLLRSIHSPPAPTTCFVMPTGHANLRPRPEQKLHHDVSGTWLHHDVSGTWLHHDVSGAWLHHDVFSTSITMSLVHGSITMSLVYTYMLTYCILAHSAFNINTNTVSLHLCTRTSCLFASVQHMHTTILRPRHLHYAFSSLGLGSESGFMAPVWSPPGSCGFVCQQLNAHATSTQCSTQCTQCSTQCTHAAAATTQCTHAVAAATQYTQTLAATSQVFDPELMSFSEDQDNLLLYSHFREGGTIGPINRSYR